ncbi:MAG: MmcQ/YjbR family DNA-binding protein [Fimbriimonas sp.]|nr:MmcQ/YjbR family DNA-binding protein [Fimbriimonas sp.]
MSEIFKSIQAYCLVKEGAFEDHPWGDPVWKVGPKGKIFCFGGLASMTVRATLDEQSALIQLPGIQIAAYVGRYGWIIVDLSQPQNLEFAPELIDRSYELVLAKSSRAPARQSRPKG